MEQQNDKAKEEKKRFSLPLVSNKTYYIIISIFILIGLGGGYLYYSQVACSSGGCAINSNPYFSMLWGGLVGFLLPDFFVRKKKE